MSRELRGSKEKGEEVIVIKTPNSVRPRRFQPVSKLQFPHQTNVFPKDTKDNSGIVLFLVQKPESRETKEENEKVELVPGSIVDAFLVSKRVCQVS